MSTTGLRETKTSRHSLQSIQSFEKVGAAIVISDWHKGAFIFQLSQFLSHQRTLSAFVFLFQYTHNNLLLKNNVLSSSIKARERIFHCLVFMRMNERIFLVTRNIISMTVLTYPYHDNMEIGRQQHILNCV